MLDGNRSVRLPLLERHAQFTPGRRLVVLVVVLHFGLGLTEATIKQARMAAIVDL